jgi:hypothetical protein
MKVDLGIVQARLGTQAAALLVSRSAASPERLFAEVAASHEPPPKPEVNADFAAALRAPTFIGY